MGNGTLTGSYDSGIAIDEFLAADFSSMGAHLIARCMKIEGKRLYLSGATGFFGKNLLALLAYLHRQGASFQVTALSRAPQRFLQDEAWCRSKTWLEWQRGDILQPWPANGHYDLLLHAATETSTGWHSDKGKVFDEILAGARHALGFAAAHRVRRILLCGSGAQYGAIPASLSEGLPESSSFGCDSTRVGSAYGEAKRASELLAAVHAERYGFAVINTRCFAFVGPGLRLDGHFAIGNFIRNALAGVPIKLASAGHASRSYLYGADLAVWLLILLLEVENGAKINVGSDRALQILDLAEKVRDLVNPGVTVQTSPAVSEEERSYYIPSIASARHIGLDAWTDLDHAIIRTALWHRIRRAGATS